MQQLTTFIMVLFAIFIWWAALSGADAQYYVDQYQAQQEQNTLQEQQNQIMRQQLFQQQQQEFNRQQEQIRNAAPYYVR